MLHSRVAARHTDDLVVPASLVGHPEHPDRPAVDQTAGKSRLLDQHQRVERITVLAEGLLDEAVVRRVPGRGKEHPVQPDPVGVVIHLVLVALPLRDLDRDVEMHLSSFRSRADGMQRLPSALVSPKRRQPVRRAPCIRKMTNLGGRGVRASRPILPASLAALVVVVAVGAVAVRHNRDAQRTTARSAAVRSPAAVPAPSPPPLLLPEVTDGHPAPTPAGLAAALAPPLADPAGVGAGWPSVTSGSSSGGGLGAGTAAGERTAADRAVVRCASRLWRTATAPTATTTTRAARLAGRMGRDARTPRPPRFVILRMHGARRTGWRRFGDTNADGKRCMPSARDRKELRCISTSRSRSRRGSATSTRWITTPTGSGWTGCSLPRPGTRRTTASSRRPSARTVIRSTRWCWSRSRPFPAV